MAGEFPRTVHIAVSPVKFGLSLSKTHCLCAVRNETLLQSCDVFQTLESACILLKVNFDVFYVFEVILYFCCWYFLSSFV